VVARGGAAADHRSVQSPTPPRLRVLVADDHRLYRRAVAGAIRGRPELVLVGEAADGCEALTAIREAAPDVAVLDVHMPLLDGRAVLDAVVREALPTRVLLLTAEAGPALGRAALHAGAAGCLAKDTDADALCDAIVAAAAGTTPRNSADHRIE
jgi:two-component system, NarL family, nitrate/nitrite response regulator NarL